MFGGTGAGDSEAEGVSLRLALGAALALLVGVRLLTFGSVFRGGDVVLLSNDPYAFLYLVERALTEGAIGRANAETFWRGEPLLIWTLAFFSALLGGVERADLVLAWYPVVTALASGLLVFALARTLTHDVRIALAAVVVLAVTPLHASRTALGFADHHAFDYFWLILAATALAWLVVRTDAERRRRWAVGGVLGFAIAGQTLAWEASPLMLVPVAGAVGAGSLVVVRTDEPADTLAPVVAGFGLAAVVVQAVHRTLFWHNAVVAGTPVLLFLGGLVVLGLTAAVDRLDRTWPALLVAELATVALGALVAFLLAPGFVGEALGLVDGFGAYVDRLQPSGIGETAPITAAFGPVAGPIALLGFAPFLGLPAVLWGVLRGWREREAGWIVLAVYVLWFLALSFVQRRFAVQLGLFLAVFAGVGFVGLAHWLALVLPPMWLRDEPPEDGQQTLDPPDRQRLALLGTLGAVGVGAGSVFSGYILSRISVDEAAYRAAAWMREYAGDRGWTYPRNYVFAEWGRVRMYNYFVNGESRQYAYARQNYEDFVFGVDEAAWYERIRDRVGFVVTRPVSGAGRFHIQSRLHEHCGSASEDARGVGHYRAVWESDDDAAKVFTLVPGATVAGEATPNAEFELSTTVTLAGTERTIRYARRGRADSEGSFSVVLAHPGEYEVAGEPGALRVDEATVLDGSELTLEL